MEVNLYLCSMPKHKNLTYFKQYKAGADAPESSLLCFGKNTGSSGSFTSVLDFIGEETKSVGKLFNLSMSTILLFQILIKKCLQCANPQQATCILFENGKICR